MPIPGNPGPVAQSPSIPRQYVAPDGKNRSTGRIGVFAELDRQIAEDQELRAWRERDRRVIIAPVPDISSAPNAFTYHQVLRLRNYYVNHPCFVCLKKNHCSHREAGVGIALMERTPRAWGRNRIMPHRLASAESLR